jgi:hypothetical protein
MTDKSEQQVPTERLSNEPATLFNSFIKNDLNVSASKINVNTINVAEVKHRHAFRPSIIKDLNSKKNGKQTPPKRQNNFELPFLIISNKKQ